MKQKKLQEGKCYLCGEHGVMTTEHMPPEGFFAHSTKVSNKYQLITVLAHAECNETFSQRDDLLRNLLILTSGDSTALEIRQKKFTDALRRNPTLFKDYIIYEDVPSASNPGKTERRYAVKLNVELLTEFMTRLIKAMHFKKYGHPLNPALKIDIWRMPDSNAEGYITHVFTEAGIPVKFIKEKCVGKEYEFEYLHVVENTDEIALVVARFFNNVTFAAQANFNLTV